MEGVGGFVCWGLQRMVTTSQIHKHTHLLFNNNQIHKHTHLLFNNNQIHKHTPAAR